MRKLASAELNIIASAPEHLRKLAHVVREQNDEIRDLKAKLAAKEELDRAAAIVSKMESKGQDIEGDTLQEKVAHILSEGADLNVLERAVDMMAPDGSLVATGDGHSNGISDFESYVLGDIS